MTRVRSPLLHRHAHYALRGCAHAAHALSDHNAHVPRTRQQHDGSMTRTHTFVPPCARVQWVAALHTGRGALDVHTARGVEQAVYTRAAQTVLEARRDPLHDVLAPLALADVVCAAYTARMAVVLAAARAHGLDAVVVETLKRADGAAGAVPAAPAEVGMDMDTGADATWIRAHPRYEATLIDVVAGRDADALGRGAPFSGWAEELRTRFERARAELAGHTIRPPEGDGQAALFRCPRCASYKTRVYAQTFARRADEPGTAYVVCDSCVHKWTEQH